MKTKLILAPLVCILVIAGCASKNHTAVRLKYTKETKQLTVERTASARNFSKLKTKVHGDTLELAVYDKPFFLTFSEKKKGIFEFEQPVPDSIRFIQYGINVYALDELQTTHGEFVYPDKKKAP